MLSKACIDSTVFMVKLDLLESGSAPQHET